MRKTREFRDEIAGILQYNSFPEDKIDEISLKLARSYYDADQDPRDEKDEEILHQANLLID